MKIRQWANVALLAASLLCGGCKGFWDAPPNGGGGGGGTTASSGEFYVANTAASQIAGFYINAGTITALPGSPYAMAAAPISLTIAPNNSFLYASTINGIYLYTIAANGQLSLANNGNPISSDQAVSMQVSANNSWLIDAESGVPQLFAIPINPSTGMAASSVEQFVNLPAANLQQLAISPDNLHVIAAMGTGGTAVIPFTPGNANPFGAVTTIPVLNTAGSALSVAVDPQDRVFYVGETAATAGSNTGGLRAFNLSTLAELTNSPFASAGLAPYSILPVTLSGASYVYVANRQVSDSATGVISGFSLSASGTTYSLTALASTFTAGAHTVELAEDNTGNFLFAVNYDGSPDLTGYTFSTTNAGYLTTAISAATGTDPVQASSIAALH